MKNNKITSLQTLRAVCFLMIFFFHAQIGNLGALAVSVFFILSGFVITYSYKTDNNQTISIKECLQFSLNKIKKLYPLHLVMMILILIFYITIQLIKGQQISIINYGAKFFFGTTLTQSLIPNSKIIFSLNGASWYLSTSLFVYMSFPIIYAYLIKIKNSNYYKRNIIITFIIQLLLSVLLLKIDVNIPFTDRFDRWFTYNFPLFRIGDFFIGCNMGFLFKNFYKKPSKLISFILEIISIIIIIIINNFIYPNSECFLGSDAFKYTIVNIPVAIALVYLFSYNEGIITNLLSRSKVLLRIGNLSGYLFLTHQVVIFQISSITKYIPIVNTSILCVIIMTSIEFGISYLLAIIYKKMFSSYKIRVSKKINS